MVAGFDGVECFVVTEAAFAGAGHRRLGIVVALVAALQIDLHSIIRFTVLMTETALDIAGFKECIVLFVIIHIQNTHGLRQGGSAECSQDHHQY